MKVYWEKLSKLVTKEAVVGLIRMTSKFKLDKFSSLFDYVSTFKFREEIFNGFFMGDGIRRGKRDYLVFKGRVSKNFNNLIPQCFQSSVSMDDAMRKSTPSVCGTDISHIKFPLEQLS